MECFGKHQATICNIRSPCPRGLGLSKGYIQVPRLKLWYCVLCPWAQGKWADSGLSQQQGVVARRHATSLYIYNDTSRGIVFIALGGSLFKQCEGLFPFTVDPVPARCTIFWVCLRD